MNRLDVIDIRQPGSDGYWDETTVSTIRQRNDASLLDREQSLQEQFPGVDAVI